MITYLSKVIILNTLPFMQFYQCPQKGIVRGVKYHSDGEIHQYEVEIKCAKTVRTEWVSRLIVRESK